MTTEYLYTITNVWFDEDGTKKENKFTTDDYGEIPTYAYCFDEVDDLPDGKNVDYTIIVEEIFNYCPGDYETPPTWDCISEKESIFVCED